MDISSLTTDQPTNPIPKRRWFQYSLRTLLIVVTLFAVACSWFVVKMRQAREQREAVAAIRKLGGQVLYEYEQLQYENSAHRSGSPVLAKEPSSPAWLRNLLGVDFFHNVTTAFVYSDNGLDRLEGLTRLQRLYFVGSQVTDAEFARLKRLTGLQKLYLSDAQVTDAGLEHIKGLINLQVLDLSNTSISDAGLEHLKGLTKLETLDLGKIKVTETAVNDLQKVLPKLKITR